MIILTGSEIRVAMSCGRSQIYALELFLETFHNYFYCYQMELADIGFDCFAHSTIPVIEVKFLCVLSRIFLSVGLKGLD
jgi:hypothetical protein